MSTALAPSRQPGQALTTADHNEAIRTALKSSLYPGASDASIDLVLSYCAASGLDPMTKPVHIVPMSVTVGKDERGYAIKEMRDIVMPGIGLYRINAARTNAYAGCSEPVFGPTMVLEFQREVWTDGANNRRVKTLEAASIEYPEWCRVTVRKLLGTMLVEFTAVEYWLENYASKGDSGAPNAMWEKRAYGQLAKCTEAQALRKAFPEAVGSQPTAEEMEGKGDFIDVTPTVIAAEQKPARPALPECTPEHFEKNFPAWEELIASGTKSTAHLLGMLQSKLTLTADQIRTIEAVKLRGDAPTTEPAPDAQA